MQVSKIFTKICGPDRLTDLSECGNPLPLWTGVDSGCTLQFRQLWAKPCNQSYLKRQRLAALQSAARNKNSEVITKGPKSLDTGKRNPLIQGLPPQILELIVIH